MDDREEAEQRVAEMHVTWGAFYLAIVKRYSSSSVLFHVTALESMRRSEQKESHSSFFFLFFFLLNIDVQCELAVYAWERLRC